MARLLSDYCLQARPSQTVLIEAKTPALPLIEALVPTLLERGAYPLVLLEYPEQERHFLEGAGAWLEQIPPIRRQMAEAADASLRIYSEENPLSLTGVDPARMARHRKAWRELAEIRLGKPWALTLYPTPGYAQQAGMGTARFREFVGRALFLDRPDPVAAWRELSAFQAALIERLGKVRMIRLEAPGTDLRLSVEGRTWVNSDGRRNMPSGEVFTGPQETSAEGQVSFNLPAVVAGQQVEGVYLRFEGGRWSRPGPSGARGICTPRSRATREPAFWASSASAPTTASTVPPGSCSSTRRSAGACTWPWATATPRPAGPTDPRCTGIWCST